MLECNQSSADCVSRLQIIETVSRSEGLEHHLVYGLEFTVGRDGGDAVIRIEDISSIKTKVEGLLQLMERNDVSPCHFQDIVEDFLIQ